MFAQNSHLSPASTASESEGRPSSWESGDGSQGADVKEEAHIQEDERIAEQVRTKEEGPVKDENRFQNPSDAILESAEHDEKVRLRGLIDLRYRYSVTRDPNSLSTGRSTSSIKPGSISRASTEYLMDDDDMEVIHHGLEVIHTLPVSSSKHRKERRLRTPSPPSLSEYPCLHPNCGHISSRAHNLKRHMTLHFPPTVDELLECKYEWCGRRGPYGFKREDHRKEHYRKIHMKGIEYPRMGKSGRTSGRS